MDEKYPDWHQNHMTRMWTLSVLPTLQHINHPTYVFNTVTLLLFFFPPWESICLKMKQDMRLSQTVANTEKARVGNGWWGRERESVFSIRVNPVRQFGPPFQRPNGRWTVMDSACGLLINPRKATGEPPSTCSKLNKAYPEMALFFLNSPSAPLSSLSLTHCRRLEQIKQEM